MDRRQFLTLAAALSAGAASLPSKAAVAASGAKEMRVVVAGAGIVGASIAYSLAKAGAEVTVIDAVGPASHASRGTFAWINATWAKQPQHYHRLNQTSVDSWHELQEELQIPITWGGSIEWFASAERQQRLAEQIAEQVRWGEPAQMINAEKIADLEPRLRFGTQGLAAYSPNDGAVDPILATQLMLKGAQSLGADIVYPNELKSVSLDKGRLVSVKTTMGSIKADRLILATGAAQELPKRIANIDIPQRTTPGIIGISEPMPRLLNSVVAAPGVHLHQRSDGRFVIGEQAGAPASHEQRLVGRPNDFPSSQLVGEHGSRLLQAATEFLPDLKGTRMESVFIGWRPLPLDGHPVLGVNPDRPDVYLAIMHSGVSLAPIVGSLVAKEILSAEPAKNLEPYRPTREFANVSRY
ncbi:FAD-binding oxidoreductase [Congregibacter brevis]|uniref:FAD-binding oxidoreductase n=1 Tax=Congregibacter brevis TaxID=3081201 RepID=A0ABZ0IHA5_9GAMM|nr:FAD-binding oxidoreductase [Congregibacter sp. IMCC45268]